MISLAWHPTCIMLHRLRAEGLPVKCLPPSPQAPVPEGEDVGTILERDEILQCWLHDGMLQRIRVHESKRCSELLAALLCSSPIPCLSGTGFMPQFPCPSPQPLPLLLPSVSVKGEDPSAKKSCKLLPSCGLGT